MKRLSVITVLTLSMSLFGCGGSPSIFEDNDGDGYSATEGDCDDTNADVGPGAEEIWYDGFDQNCDGSDDFDADGDGDIGGPNAVDCDDTDAMLNSNDNDDDGFSTCENDCDDNESAAFPGSAPNESDANGCFLDLDGDGYGDESPDDNIDAGTDCDDNTQATNPGATEVWYNQVDENCDGNDADQDSDGDLHKDHGGGDCNDMDHSINSTDAQEVGGNAIDEDCDGRVFNNAAADQVFNNEMQVTNFCSSYDRIYGVLSVENSPIVNLDLSCLVEVTGDIYITYNSSLETIDLSGLTGVSGSINVYYNQSLVSLDLSSVSSIHDTSNYNYLGYSNTLETIDLSSLASIENAIVYITDTYSLEVINLDALSSILNSSFYIRNHDSLTDLSFPSLMYIDGYLSIYNNPSATFYDLPLLQSLTNGGGLSLSNSELLSSIDLQSLSTIEEAGVEIYNTGLTSISLPALDTVMSDSMVYIASNADATSISMPELSSVTDTYIGISNNDLIESITIPGQVAIVNGYLSIDQNASLYDISSFYSLSSASGSQLSVSSNTNLCTDDVENLAYYVGLRWESVYISGNKNCQTR